MTTIKSPLHFRRLEFKYLLQPGQVALMRQLLPNYMELDPFVRSNNFYQVNSVYFDDHRFTAYYQKLAGLHRRQKLRLRGYAHTNSHQHFFELKRKIGPVIMKDRVAIGEAEIKLSNRQLVSRVEALHEEPDLCEEVMFKYLKQQAAPTVFVGYKRTPFVSPVIDRFRITIDADLTCRSVGANEQLTLYQAQQSRLQKILPGMAVLEVKFNGILPGWFRQIIETLRLEKSKFSKYCAAVSTVYGSDPGKF